MEQLKRQYREERRDTFCEVIAMTKELHAAFNNEVDRYRNVLLYCARQREWETFKLNAGKLFDYVEAIEMSETERRFLKVFIVIMVALFCAAVLILGIDPAPYGEELQNVKKLMIVMTIVGCCFELFFFASFRHYMENKSVSYKKRRSLFIRVIERDFYEICLTANKE